MAPPDPTPKPLESSPPSSPRPGEQVIRIVVDTAATSRKSWWSRVLLAAFLFSLLLNFALYSAYGKYFRDFDGPTERFHSGSRDSADKIARISLSGTIMPPFTERLLKQIDKAAEDSSVKGILLVVDSPGGLVADSHQIYHKLQLLAQSKPVFVQMKRIAASGGYYVAMAGGAEGKIYAEPTTWTGSIGVIIPHYDLTGVADQWGVKSQPLTTGEFKDALSSFKPLTDREKEVWTAILNDAFERFLSVIQAGRPNLDRPQIQAVATGQVFTSDQALERGLIDVIGFEETAIQDLQKQLGLTAARVIEYQHPPTLSDFLMGSARGPSELSLLRELFESPTPRAFFLLGSPRSTL